MICNDYESVTMPQCECILAHSNMLEHKLVHERKGMNMCAIAGILDLPVENNIRNNILKTMARRGPDENGIYQTENCTLFHSRLTIIDPTGGKQPMTLMYGGEEYTIVYNGELYNTDEIRRGLHTLGHQFLSHSDTEVILHAYAQWGEDMLPKLNGIFGLAIWERKRKTLFLARDRMGVKPLFYCLHRGGLLFASEMKTLLAYPTVSAKLDAEGVAELLLLGPGRTPGSGILRGMQEIEPGCCARYRRGKWTLRRYWKLTDTEHTDSFEDTAEKVRFLVTDSIRRQMVSDFPIGTFLSGGLDSSIISAVCAEELRCRGQRLPTFSLDYHNNDKYFKPEKFKLDTDNAYISLMQTCLNTDANWTVLQSQQLVDALPSTTDARDLPGMADVDSSLLLFCGNIRNHVKVALSGECADEIFGGYPWYRDPAVRDTDGFPWAQNTTYRRSFLLPWINEQIDSKAFVQDRYMQTIHECDILPGTPQDEQRIKQMVNLNHRWFMQTLLDRKDRMSMYCGLEVRVPFCDYRIAEYLYGVPWHYKDHEEREKGLLRYAMRGILPEQVLHRKKSPYPKTYDPRYFTLVSEQLQRVLDNQQSPILRIVDKTALENLMTTEYAWPWYGQLMRVPQTIAYMLQLNYWLDTYSVQLV